MRRLSSDEEQQTHEEWRQFSRPTDDEELRGQRASASKVARWEFEKQEQSQTVETLPYEAGAAARTWTWSSKTAATVSPTV